MSIATHYYPNIISKEINPMQMTQKDWFFTGIA